MQSFRNAAIKVADNGEFQSRFEVYGQDFIDTVSYNKLMVRLRSFFLSKGFIEASVQDRLSILAACEDPTTIQTYNFHNTSWPLPQTGQMWLEYELLTKPDVAGYFCVGVSYREEKNPVPGRHLPIFPMLDFEFHGGIEVLKKLEKELIDYLGIDEDYNVFEENYYVLAKKYNVKELNSEHEMKIWEEYGKAFMLCNFPSYTSPFWNMKVEKDHSVKVDVIICGQETIGSAERENDPDVMYKKFNTISDGKYAELLYTKFGQDRVKKELEDYLGLKFFQRCGGGIGITRLLRAMNICRLL
jgi:aspartyl/asparaginyl-tRNA synthetase